MKSVYSTLGFALGASAAILVARDQCCFSLTAAGGKTGAVGQLSDGQNRIGQTSGLVTGQATYCINNGVNSNGDLTCNGNTQFYACATGDNGGYNIYTTTASAQTGCVAITLSSGGKCAGSNGSSSSSAASSAAASSAAASSSKPASSAPAFSAPASPVPTSSAPAGNTVTVYSTYITVTNCAAGCTPVSSASASKPASPAPASSKHASSAPTSSAPASSKPASSAPASGTAGGNGNACQTTLSGAYQTPHAIIPVNKNSSSTSYGTQYNAHLSSSNSTIFNFDIPSSYAGKQCSVIFLLPNKSQLVTSDFTLSGAGGIKFDQLTSPAPLSVTYATYPAVKSTLDTISSVTPGNSYVVSSGACQAGSTISILASATGSLELSLFEDWDPSAIGLFITSC
ncbi:hypothetical protein KCU98_g1660, partial [Aureobasidium melanogenum]